MTNELPGLRALAFDLDGTLGDTLPACIAAFRHSIRRHAGLELTDAEIAARFGPTEEGMLASFLDGDADAAIETYLTEYESLHARCADPFPGLLDLVRALDARGVRLAIVTGKGPRSAAISLRVLGLAQLIPDVSCGSPDAPVKVKRLRALLARWDIAPGEVAYVGDSPSDVADAKEVGVRAIAAGWAPSADVAALARSEPEHLFEDVAGFAAWALDQTRG